jgi:hypothetical protein
MDTNVLCVNLNFQNAHLIRCRHTILPRKKDENILDWIDKYNFFAALVVSLWLPGRTLGSYLSIVLQ